jgi:hypothetical protein
MSARPKFTPSEEVTRSAADLEKLARRLKRATIAGYFARALSIVFATLAVAAIAAVTLEYSRERHRADVRRDCLAAADQLSDFADRVALITRSPACAPVVDVTRSR